MQEDDQGKNDHPLEPEQQSPSEGGAGRSNPAPEQQPSSTNGMEEDQAEHEEQPPVANKTTGNVPEPQITPRLIGSAPSAAGTPPLTPDQRRRQFLKGLGIGCIPLLFSVVGAGLIYGPIGGYFEVIAAVLYLIQIGVTIALFRTQKSVAQGLLTMLAVSPVVSCIACYVAITRPPGA